MATATAAPAAATAATAMMPACRTRRRDDEVTTVRSAGRWRI
jgi:hypothetical protein